MATNASNNSPRDEPPAPLSWRFQQPLEPTIRAAMLLAATHNWKSRQVDFTLAFCQSPQKRPVYMELPQYYKPKGCEG